MFEQILWYLFVPSALIYIVMIVMSFIGLEADVDVDVDTDGDVNGSDLLEVFTFRNAVNFAFGYSSGALIAIKEFSTDEYIATMVGGCTGFGLVIITMGIFYLFKKFEEKVETDYNSLVQSEATVYLTIPSNSLGMGKINVSLQGTSKVLKAVTNGVELKTNSTVIIESITENGVATVKLKS